MLYESKKDFNLEDLSIIDRLGSVKMILSNSSGKHSYHIVKTTSGYNIIYNLNKLEPIIMDTIDEIFVFAQAHETRELIY